MKNRLITFFCFIVFGSALPGCNPSIKTESVEGIVTLDEKPLEGALVTFSVVEESTGLPAFGRTDANGVFKMTAAQGSRTTSGALIGSYRVAVIKEAPERDATAEELKKQDETGIPLNIRIVSIVPKKYNDVNTSGLTADVKPGKNNLKFELSSK